MSKFEYGGTLYRTEKQANLACIHEWLFADNLSGDETPETLAAEFVEMDWRLPYPDGWDLVELFEEALENR